MLETLVSVINFFKTTVYFVLYWSYKTGYLLVNGITAAFYYLLAFSESVVTFFAVLYESLAIFLQDNLQFIQQVLSFAASNFDTICVGIANIVHKITGLIYAVGHFVTSSYVEIFRSITAIIWGMIQMLYFLQKLFILFGSGVWFLITLIPLLLYYLCALFVTLVNRFIEEIGEICYSGVSSVKTFVKGTVLFVSEVPLESMAGILIALSLAYIVHQFYVTIKSYCRQKLSNLRRWYQQQHLVVRNMPQIRTSTPRQDNQNPRFRGRRPVRPIQLESDVDVAARSAHATPRSPAKSQKNESIINDEKHCVICQERNKCILLLPCRHLCLCAECNLELRYYTLTCPICRSNIDSTLEIYA